VLLWFKINATNNTNIPKVTPDQRERKRERKRGREKEKKKKLAKIETIGRDWGFEASLTLYHFYTFGGSCRHCRR
jgi:hypothetical protein